MSCKDYAEVDEPYLGIHLIMGGKKKDFEAGKYTLHKRNTGLQQCKTNWLH